ncbi:TIGR01620 family protein [Thalassotalea sp. M1531]|uniref:TIGR01620 family protein n=1 Tax=Thalassotalea algicola TaxID=2716224 RepID=A0A7Y0LFH2_9GAMM|nr:TIGR01620 family protein [Thalassotalea algicola]NMP33353.1 TIGR01620 family protein [Thalassotalea algicola]
MTKPTKFQQQILFEEQEVKVQGEEQLPVVQQVVVDNESWQQIDDEDEQLFEQDINSSSGWMWKIFVSLFAVVVGIELVEFFTIGLTESPILTSLYGLLLIIVGVVASSSLIKEFSGLSQLKSREKLRGQLTELNDSDAFENAAPILEKVTSSLATDFTVEQTERWQQTLAKGYSDPELIKLYSRQVLSETDNKALAEVARFSSESVVLVALSPIAILDMLIMLWRNLKMIDKVAGLYGLKLGYWSRIKLIKQVIANMVYAGASEVVADVSADMLGADIMGKLSGRLAQGLGAGMLTARLGLKAIYMCRPVPFDESAPKLSQVRTEVVGQIKQLVKGTKR